MLAGFFQRLFPYPFPSLFSSACGSITMPFRSPRHSVAAVSAGFAICLMVCTAPSVQMKSSARPAAFRDSCQCRGRCIIPELRCTFSVVFVTWSFALFAVNELLVARRWFAVPLLGAGLESRTVRLTVRRVAGVLFLRRYWLLLRI